MMRKATIIKQLEYVKGEFEKDKKKYDVNLELFYNNKLTEVELVQSESNYKQWRSMADAFEMVLEVITL